MKHAILLPVFLSILAITQGQTIIRDTICATDTLRLRDRYLRYNDSTAYRSFSCSYTSRTAVRFEMGFHHFNYNKETSQWLGPHQSLGLGLAFDIHNVIFGIRLKSWTVHPNQKMAFATDTLYTEADLNPNKYDVYIGYSLNLKKNFSIEPTIGYTRSWFNVIDEKSFNKTYNILPAKGMVAGLTLNKYFRLKDRNYLAIFVNANYATTNYTSTHPNLGKGYVEWGGGLAYKLFGKSYFYKRID